MSSLLCRWLENRALRLGSVLVPSVQRTDWLRSWHAELWYEHSRGHSDLALGLLRDALWLRLDSWRQALAGTALLCLLSLSTFTVLAALPLAVFLHAGVLAREVPLELPSRFAVAAVLTLLVSYGSSFTAARERSGYGHRRWLRTSVFYALKVFLLLLLSALISTDLCIPLEAGAWFAAMPLELLCFVVFALLGLRWNQLDSQSRCQQCLRSLAPPQRVGRPSRNFLDYNGTELACLDGHGLLTVPELETSWCRSSAWVSQQ